jgi:hypothetical protein
MKRCEYCPCPIKHGFLNELLHYVVFILSLIKEGTTKNSILMTKNVFLNTVLRLKQETIFILLFESVQRLYF